MTSLNDRIRNGLPRAAVIVHDLFMVWAAWAGLNYFRHSTLDTSAGAALLSPEMLLILIVQGLIFWQVGLYRGGWPRSIPTS